MRKIKEAGAPELSAVTERELELINRYTKTPLGADDVFTFSVRLCDNETDRDFERFSSESLNRLAELFVGKTGISDHDWKSANQIARIYAAEVRISPDVSTSYGEAYMWLEAKAYMLNTPENAELINQIRGGIKKEVSVGCAVGRCTCSICGKTLGTDGCFHEKGGEYGDEICCGILEDAQDAYEWSFVAVPAQTSAGVIKGLEAKAPKTLRELCRLAYDGKFSKQLCELEKDAEAGREYLKTVRDDVVRLGAMTKLWNAENLSALCEKMELAELKSLRESLSKKADELFPPLVQFSGEERKSVYVPEKEYMI